MVEGTLSPTEFTREKTKTMTIGRSLTGERGWGRGMGRGNEGRRERVGGFEGKLRRPNDEVGRGRNGSRQGRDHES
jgi:hypothetical protein